MPDWGVFQIGQIGDIARLSDWDLRQIGAFFTELCTRVLVQAGRQIAHGVRLPPTLNLSPSLSFPDWPDWPLCQTGRLDQIGILIRLADWLHQIGVRLTSTTQYVV